MAVFEESGTLKYKDKDGNVYVMFPNTKKENVDGIEGVHYRLKGIATSGTGSEYTATVEGITILERGTSFVMVPHIDSTSTTPTLNVNGLGAKLLRRRISGNTASTTSGSTTNWIAVNRPVMVYYDGNYWIVDFDRPNVNDLYGTLGSIKVSYDNSTSGLTSGNVQDAIDELSGSKAQTKSLTTSEYNSLTEKNENTLYLITDEEDISKKTELPASGTELTADAEYRVASEVGTYEFNFPASGDVYVRFTTASTFSISFSSGTTYVDSVPTFEASTTYEIMSRDKIVSVSTVVSA